MKKFLGAVAIALSCLCGLSGCSYFLGESDTLLKSPKPGGELGKIREALMDSVGKKFTLECAKSGEWRNAYIVRDMDGDGEEEALAFYSTETDDTTELHVTVITENRGRWKVISDTRLGGTDIERIEFGDLDSDKSEEAIIAWSIYGAPETRLTVLDISGNKPAEMYEGGYTDFCLYNMDKAKGKELVLITSDPTAKTAQCRLLTAKDGSISEASVVSIDSSFVACKKIHKTKIDGNPALFIDAATAEGGMFTEIIVSSGGLLSAPLSRRGGKSAVITGRSTQLLCGDVNGDGVPEIPCTTMLPNGGNSDATLGLTEWKSYENGKLTTKEKSVISKLLQYKITVDSDWQGGFSCVYSGSSDGTDLYTYNAKKGLGQKVLSIIAVSADSFKASDYKDMFTLAENETTVYLGKIHIKDNPFGLTEKKVKAIFSEKITEEN